MVSGNGRPLPILQIQINDEITMDPISGEPDKHAQVTGRPDNMSDAFLHEDCYDCEWMMQAGRHDAISNSCVNPKIK
jgi:hypothetical protein